MIWRICLFVFMLNFALLAQLTGPQTPAPTTTSTPQEGWNMGLTIGAVTIDNVIYNQIGLRPEFVVGKFGIALDLTLYIDPDGNIRKDNWDSFNDIIEKIYYVRWGLQGDPFYAKVGAIDNYRLGYGLLMNRYRNTIQYPAIIRTGLELGFQGEKFGGDVMMNDFKELGRPGGVFAGRLTYKLIGNLTLGANVVYDRNQYASLPDKDKDGVPDALDNFPKDKKYAVDTDGDGVPDSIDPDRDGDGYTDNSQDTTIANNDSDFNPATDLKPNPFNMKEARDKEQLGFGVDLGLPIFTADYLQLTLYGQAAKYAYGNGWGIGAPGLMAKLGFINLYAEYRRLDKKFIPEYFNSTYEIERVFFVQDVTTGDLTLVTKRKLMSEINHTMQGYVAGADFFIGNLITFSAMYQNMKSSKSASPEFNTLIANLDLNTKMIPKIQRAGAYYYQQNVNKLFPAKQEGTIFGYQLQYEIGAGTSLLLDYRTMYRDLNGDGRIRGSNETVNITNIQTVFMF